MHEKTAGTKKAPALDYGATAPGQNGLPHPVTGLTVTRRTVARGGGQGKVRSSRYRPEANHAACIAPCYLTERSLSGRAQTASDLEGAATTKGTFNYRRGRERMCWHTVSHCPSRKRSYWRTRTTFPSFMAFSPSDLSGPLTAFTRHMQSKLMRGAGGRFLGGSCRHNATSVSSVMKSDLDGPVV